MFERRVQELMITEGAGYPFAHVLPLFEDIDLLVGNLEGTFTDVGVSLDKYYSFRTDPALAIALADAGFAAVSLANNHATDYGLEGLDRTLQALDGVGVRSFGAGMTEVDARAPLLATPTGRPSVAFLGYSTVGETIFADGDGGGVAHASAEWMDGDIRAAAERADIVVVSLHSGVEYDHEPTDTQRTLARAAIDAGASVVVGHHPHVLQPWERYGDGVIFYSLGNFVFDLDAEDIGTYGIGAFQAAIALVTFEDGAPPHVDFRLAVIDPYEHRPYPATADEIAAIEDVLIELTGD
jgi:poly-gamma-glutamate synthesis protein (capsule biosynthesis protein)